ncbi:MAG: ethanolamine ammonia-lyase subunit EutC [Clostridia bacterium]
MEHIDVEELVNRVIAKLGQKTEGRAAAKQADATESGHGDAYDFPEAKQMGVTNPHNLAVIEQAQQITPARIGIGRTGTRMKTTSYLQFRIDQAAAQDAVLRDVSEAFLQEMDLTVLHTRAKDMQDYLMNLDAGRKLSDESAEWLRKHGEKGKNVQIIVSDGLSSSAVEANIKDMLPALMQGLRLKNISVGRPVFIKRGRVWVQDHVASIVNCDLVVSLIGERPGLATAESLSAYMIYRPNERTVESDRTVISNIHRGGTTPIEAGAHLADIISEILRFQASGVKFAQLRI